MKKKEGPKEKHHKNTIEIIGGNSYESFEIDDSSPDLKQNSGLVIEDIKQKTFFDTFFGVIMMLIGVLLVSGSTVLCKFAYMRNTHLNGFDYLIVRSTTLTISALFQAWSLKVNFFDIKKEGRLWLGLR